MLSKAMADETLFIADEAGMAALGARLAATLRPGDVVRLDGGLGAGKTTLARALIRALMADAALEVPSPSFALVQPYATGDLRILHADFYRLGSALEAEELGLFDDPGAIIIIEWAERAEALLPEDAIRIDIDVPQGGQGRNLRIRR